MTFRTFMNVSIVDTNFLVNSESIDGAFETFIHRGTGRLYRKKQSKTKRLCKYAFSVSDCVKLATQNLPSCDEDAKIGVSS